MSVMTGKFAPVGGGPILYEPSPWQRAFHSTAAMGIREVLGGGAAGPGKTTALLNDCNDQIAIEHERCAGIEDPVTGKKRPHKHQLQWGTSTGWALHLRRTRTMLEQTIAKSKLLFKAIDPGADWNEQKSTWTFSSGFKYQFGHCKDPDDYLQYYSSEFSWIGFDELTQFLESQYMQIGSRLRSSDPVLSLMLRIRSMTNPFQKQEGSEVFVTRDPRWVWKRFVEPDPKGNVVRWRKIQMSDGTFERSGILYMPARLEHNPDKEFRRKYEINLRTMPIHIQAALLKGDWNVTEGSFFAEYWREDLHVCKPFTPSKDWRYFRSMDWGFKAPGVIHWWALDDDDTLWCIKEFKFQGKTDVEVAAAVRAIEETLGLWDGEESLITGPADNQLWEQRGSATKSMGHVFAEKGVPWVKADKRSRITNAGHVIKRLRDHDDGTKVPGLVFFSSCRYIISTLPSVQTSPHNSEEPADGGDDHAIDSVFYGVAYASKGKGAVPPKRTVKDEWEQEDGGRDTLRKGRYGYGQELC